MRVRKHPLDATILAVVNGTSSGTEKDAVEAHIRHCARCRTCYEECRKVLCEIAELAGLPRLDQLRGSRELPQTMCFGRPATAGVVFTFVAAVLVVSCCLYLWRIPKVSAGELLSQAERIEKKSTSSRRYLFHASGT